ncbi:unnamed protein product [Rhodiola kirilowii]
MAADNGTVNAGSSTTVIVVNGVDLPTNEDAVINYGSEICAGPEGKGYLTYRFEAIPSVETCSTSLKITIDVEHAKCSICLNLWHDVVTVAPCLHDFCNGCFSEWLRRSQLKHTNVLCPHCRGVIQCVGRNHFMHNIEQDILRADPSLRRSDEEITHLDSFASIKSNLVLGTNGGRKSRKRTRAPADVDPPMQMESPVRASTCLQCGLGCDRAYCGAYWPSLSVTGSATHRVCSRETFLPISERTISRIPFLTHNRNRQEQDITERCIQGLGKTLQAVISEWTLKFNSRQIDRSLLRLKHAEMITAGTHVCK